MACKACNCESVKGHAFLENFSLGGTGLLRPPLTMHTTLHTPNRENLGCKSLGTKLKLALCPFVRFIFLCAHNLRHSWAVCCVCLKMKLH